MTIKHTPGPYFIDSRDDYRIVYAVVDGHRIEIAYEPHHTRFYESCSITDADGTTANINLIASAPELLEALKKTLNWLSSYPGGGALDTWKQAHVAIKKAEEA